MKKIFIFGAGGHAKSVFNIVEKLNYEAIAFYDDTITEEKILFDKPVINDKRKIKNYLKNDVEFVVAIGDNFKRKKFVESLNKEFTLKYATLVDPDAIVSKRSRINSGTVVMPGAIVSVSCEIGCHCIVNTGSQLDHDCSMSDYSSLGPGAICGGGVKIGLCAVVGLGAKIIEKTSVGDYSILGANSLLLKDLPSYILAYGIPAVEIKKIEPGYNYLK